MKNLSRALKFGPVADGEAIFSRGEGTPSLLFRESLSIVIWNVCKGLGGSRFHADFSYLLQKTDLFLLQEALLTSELRPKFFTHDRVSIHGCSYLLGDGTRDGVMTISRAKPSFQERYLSLQAEPVLGTPKACLLTRFAISGQEQQLLVFNVHSTLIRSIQQSIEEVRRYLPLIAEHDGPVIFAGDFNTVTPAYLASLTTILAEVGIQRLEVPGDPRGRFGALDHFFYRGLVPKGCEVLAEFSSSDHFPLIASFDLVG